MSELYAGRYLFVMGCPRSGTTALKTLLNGHQAIALGEERYGSRYDHAEFLDPSLFEGDRFFRLMEGDTFYPDLEAATPEFGALKSRYGEAQYRGDKIPFLYRYLPRLLDTFQARARVVVSIRNIFDVADSYNRRADNPADLTWESGRANSAVAHWNEAIEAALTHGVDPRILLVRYEELFQAGRGLKALFSFLDLELTSDVLAAHRRLLAESIALDYDRQPTLSYDEIDDIRKRADFPGYREVLERCRRSLSDDVTEPEPMTEGSRP